MKYQSIDYVEKPVSRMIFGCAIPPMLEGKCVDTLLDAVYQTGINTFDTAQNYQKSEVSLGQWVEKRGLREKVVLISKCCHPFSDGLDRVRPECIYDDLKASLEQAKTDYFDIYLLHRDDLCAPVGPIIEALNELHEKGKIGAFGVSNWTVERIAKANAYAQEHGMLPFTISSPNFGLARQAEDPWGGGAGAVTISGPENAESREWYKRNQMPVFAYSSIGRGFFSGRVHSTEPEKVKEVLDEFAVKGYACEDNFKRLARAEKLAKEKGCTVAQLAMAWVFHVGLNVFAIVGSQRAENIQSNVAALDVTLTQEEADWLDLRG